MKFLLINPEPMGRYWRPATPHVGLGYLAEFLLANGHKVEVADMRLGTSFEEVAQQIKRFKPDYVGLSTASLEYQKVYDLVAKIKGLFAVKVIMGGPHPSVVKEQVLQYSLCDLAVFGEGEMTILEIAKGVPYAKIHGLIWRDRKGEIVVNPEREVVINLDRLPFPKYKKFPLEKYLEHKIALVAERGCPYACTYCASRLILGRGMRRRSPKNILKEIRYWYGRGYREFGFNDDEFTGVRYWVMEICDLIIKSGMKCMFELRTGIRVDKVDEEMLRKMKQAGFFYVAFGAESADRTVLETAEKGITLRQIREAVKLAKKVGFEVGGFFMIGLPWDTPEKFQKTLAFAKSLDLSESRFYNAVPYPGSEFYDWVLKYGRFLYPPAVFLNRYDRLVRDPVFETREFTADQRRVAYDQGERFFVERLYVKTVGATLAKPFIFLSQVNYLRWLIIKIGFRLTPYVRQLQKVRRQENGA